MNLNLDEIVTQLRKMPPPYERNAVDICLAGDEATVNRLLSELHDWVHSEDPSSEKHGMLPIYGLHILGYLNEPKLHSLLLKIVDFPETHPAFDALGDYRTERLFVELFRTSSGDFTGIRKALMNPEADIYARWECVRSLEAAAAFGKIPMQSFIDELLGYLNHQIQRFEDKEKQIYSENDYAFASIILGSLCDLKVSEQNDLVQKAFSLNLLDTDIIDLKTYRMLYESKEQHQERLRKDVDATVHEALEGWACFQPEEPWHVRTSQLPRRVKSQNKKQKIGRNDPCICGSGIKYKKCCLEQEI